jgi:AbrB family looped-hinge helix DNA binding protein
VSVKVGPKGQVVISKEIRDRLGVEPGWRAIQILIDDHVEIYFLPPEHDESLLGILAPYIRTSIPQGEPWERAREDAWEEAARERAEDYSAYGRKGEAQDEPR